MIIDIKVDLNKSRWHWQHIASFSISLLLKINQNFKIISCILQNVNSQFSFLSYQMIILVHFSQAFCQWGVEENILTSNEICNSPVMWNFDITVTPFGVGFEGNVPAENTTYKYISNSKSKLINLSKEVESKFLFVVSFQSDTPRLR